MPILAEFEDELHQVGIIRVRPRFYLSTEWGVPFETIAIAIPFYLARPDLTALHAERVGHVEGFDRADILRYLRHEMGHVVNYASSSARSPSPTSRITTRSRSAVATSGETREGREGRESHFPYRSKAKPTIRSISFG